MGTVTDTYPNHGKKRQQEHESNVVANNMIPADFEDRPPESDTVTLYDERHFVTYLRLLDAAAEDADWREVARIIFGIDAAQEPERAHSIHNAHLARAQWMARSGYRQLAGQE